MKCALIAERGSLSFPERVVEPYRSVGYLLSKIARTSTLQTLTFQSANSVRMLTKLCIARSSVRKAILVGWGERSRLDSLFKDPFLFFFSYSRGKPARHSASQCHADSSQVSFWCAQRCVKGDSHFQEVSYSALPILGFTINVDEHVCLLFERGFYLQNRAQQDATR